MSSALFWKANVWYSAACYKLALQGSYRLQSTIKVMRLGSLDVGHHCRVVSKGIISVAHCSIFVTCRNKSRYLLDEDRTAASSAIGP